METHQQLPYMHYHGTLSRLKKKIYDKIDFVWGTRLFQDKTGEAISKGKCQWFENCFTTQYYCSFITRNNTHSHTHIHSLTNNTNACHGANAHSISHRWKLSFPSAEAWGNVFTPANRAWSPSPPSLWLCVSTWSVCAHMCLPVKAGRLCHCTSKALETNSLRTEGALEVEVCPCWPKRCGENTILPLKNNLC